MDWYNHLARTGFNDIENSKEEIVDRKIRDFVQVRDLQSVDAYQARYSYYQWAREKLNDGRFTSVTDKLIWECHAEGVSQRDISPRVGLSQPWIARKLEKIEEYLKIQVTGSVSMAIA